MLFIPFLIYHVTWLSYINIFNGQYDNQFTGNYTYYEYDWGPDKHDSFYNAHLALGILLYILSLYFLINEVRQVFSGCSDYFTSVWNYTDFLPPLMIIVVVSYKLVLAYDDSFDPQTNFIITIESFACVLMWLKVLYFLRIFKSTGYLVRLITDVFKGIKTFVFILLIMYFGFSEAFLRVSEVSDPTAQFTGNYFYSFVYVFLTSIGSSGTDTFNFTIQPVYCWMLYVIFAILSNIMMLNLLVNILSGIFNEINENSVQANYQERARIISENSYLIPMSYKVARDDFDKYLILAQEVQGGDEDTGVTLTKINTLADDIVNFKKQVLDRQQVIEAKVDEILSKA